MIDNEAPMLLPDNELPMNAEQLVNSAARVLTPYQPGKPIAELERQLGIRNIVKLASNENPLGPSPKALAAMGDLARDLHRYPDGGGFELKAKLAERLGVSANQITLGNGSNDVLDMVARAFLSHETAAIFSQYAFAVYPIVSRSVGAETRIVPAHNGSRGPAYGHDLESIAKRVDPKTRVVFIANPNNPTGTYLTKTELRAFLEQVASRCVVVVDEAYFEYVERPDYPDSLEWLREFKNLVVTRTFSKAYGLAGLRVGYAVSSPVVADFLNRVRQPFNVNSLALAAATAALDDNNHLAYSRAVNQHGMSHLTSGLKARGLEYIPSIANFVAVDVGRPAAPVYHSLLETGVIVRPIANYGLPQHLRVSIGTEAENQTFLEALERVLA